MINYVIMINYDEQLNDDIIYHDINTYFFYCGNW